MVSKIFYFHPYLGKWSNLTNIFGMGWSHQPSYGICLEVWLDWNRTLEKKTHTCHTPGCEALDDLWEWNLGHKRFIHQVLPWKTNRISLRKLPIQRGKPKTHRIHLWFCLPTFYHKKFNQSCKKNIPYMDPMRFFHQAGNPLRQLYPGTSRADSQPILVAWRSGTCRRVWWSFALISLKPNDAICCLDDDWEVEKTEDHTVDSPDIRYPTTWDGHKTLVNDGIFLCQPHLVQDFLHQHFFRKTTFVTSAGSFLTKELFFFFADFAGIPESVYIDSCFSRTSKKMWRTPKGKSQI